MIFRAQKILQVRKFMYCTLDNELQKRTWERPIWNQGIGKQWHQGTTLDLVRRRGVYVWAKIRKETCNHFDQWLESSQRVQQVRPINCKSYIQLRSDSAFAFFICIICISGMFYNKIFHAECSMCRLQLLSRRNRDKTFQFVEAKGRFRCFLVKTFKAIHTCTVRTAGTMTNTA